MNFVHCYRMSSITRPMTPICLLLKEYRCTYCDLRRRRTVTQLMTARASRGYKSRTGCFGYSSPKSGNTASERIVPVTDEIIENQVRNSSLLRLVTAYREHGRKKADLDPLKISERYAPELDNRLYGFDKVSLDERFQLKGILTLPNKDEASLGEIINHLENTYCGQLSVELCHIQDEEEKEWIASLVEASREWSLNAEKKIQIANDLLKSQAFDHFVSKKFATVKRYGGEGAEGMMAFFGELFPHASSNGITELVLCIPHRGRLNLLSGLLNFPPALMFSKMKGNPEFPPELQFTGDVLSHLYTSTNLVFNDKELHISMLPNPSHLEAINPVSVGKTRAKQLTYRDGEYGNGDCGSKVMCVQVHGDAAFAAQGIIMETFCLANLPHFNVGGSIHFIVNNKLGFTTPADRAMSSAHSSDIGKFIGCPIIHVNGENPEEVVRACQLAVQYRMKFGKDVIVNFHCFRRWGHNEIDDPSFTNPSMYNIINSRKSVPDNYVDKVVTEGLSSKAEFAEVIADHTLFLTKELSTSDEYQVKNVHFQGNWSSCKQATKDTTTTWDTGCSEDVLRFVGSKSVEIPDDFNLHPLLKKTFCRSRLKKLYDGLTIDWATAEAMAIGSLLYKGYHVRISGQDVGRGTFSHRHCMLVDQEHDEIYIPMNNICTDQQGFLEVANSPLSEEAVLAFEWGMSIDHPNHLIIWESQFGDFFNGAQIIFDTFISSGETKWILQSGLVILLPHGYDGAGPEHSSCRLERFLQMSDSKEDSIDSDNVNMEIVNPTTPAQYFHLLRRQILRNYRKPIIVASPKLILRLPAAVSTLQEMAPGTHFSPIIPDVDVKPNNVKRVVFCSGKHYYALDRKRKEEKLNTTAIIRLESLVPFPAEYLKDELKKYSNAEDFVWSQEEQRNMGAWSFVNPRFQNLLNVQLVYAGRPVLGTPAVGIGSVHSKEAEQLLTDTFKID